VSCCPTPSRFTRNCLLPSWQVASGLPRRPYTSGMPLLKADIAAVPDTTSVSTWKTQATSPDTSGNHDHTDQWLSTLVTQTEPDILKSIDPEPGNSSEQGEDWWGATVYFLGTMFQIPQPPQDVTVAPGGQGQPGAGHNPEVPIQAPYGHHPLPPGASGRADVGTLARGGQEHYDGQLPPRAITVSSDHSLESYNKKASGITTDPQHPKPTPWPPGRKGSSADESDEYGPEPVGCCAFYTSSRHKGLRERIPTEPTSELTPFKRNTTFGTVSVKQARPKEMSCRDKIQRKTAMMCLNCNDMEAELTSAKPLRLRADGTVDPQDLSPEIVWARKTSFQKLKSMRI